jgi:membrane protease YdiL (CAAX protease family)
MQLTAPTTRPVPPIRFDPPWRLLLAAIGWVLCAIVASGFLASFIVNFAVGFHNARILGDERWQPDQLIQSLLMAVFIQLTLFLAAWRWSWVVGQGNRRIGLGLAPLHQPRTLIVLAIITPAVAISWPVLLNTWLKAPDAWGRLFIGAHTTGPVAHAIILTLPLAITPICEEMFFRGWLWTGLRRRWSPGRVMLGTALLWLLGHLADGNLTHLLFLTPLAILLSVARHWCSSLWASVLLHIINNGAAAAVLVWVFWLR